MASERASETASEMASERAGDLAGESAANDRESMAARNAGPGEERGHPFRFVSAVDCEYTGAVESMFFFHPHQKGLIEPIRRSVEAWGTPEILRRDNRIYLGIPRHVAQCLFACHRQREPQRPGYRGD